MKSNKVTNPQISEKYFDGVSASAKRHLLNSLQNLEVGAPPTPSFKLYGKSDWSVVTDFLESVPSSSRGPSWLFEYELSRKEKFGPQGGHAPWSELKENAELYFSRPKEVKSTLCSTEAYSHKHLDMLSAKDALKTLESDEKIQSRAAGWRAFDLKKTDPEAKKMALHDISAGWWIDGWAYFFSRFNKQKKRLFVPMPYSSMINQAQYYNPFLKSIQEDLRANLDRSEFRFWGDKIGFDNLFHKIIWPCVRGYDPSHIIWVMRDFEKMDTTMGPSQKLHYFVPKLAAAFHFPPMSDNYRKMERVMLFSNRCPIATPDGMWTGDHGEASGATVTNGGETCGNEEFDRRMRLYLRQTGVFTDGTLKDLGSWGNGDDGISAYYLDDVSKFDQISQLIREAADDAADQTQFIIQSEKWDIHLGTYGKYCQYLIDYNGKELLAYYPAALILNSIVNPEKEYKASEWDKDYRDIDIIMKLSNGRELPYFHELIDYVDNGMRFGLLGRSEEATRRILSKYDKYRALQDGTGEFNIWNPDEIGLETNPVVQYLLQKRK